MARDHFQFVWRSLRRLGVPESGADDIAQQVFEVAARRIGEILPGKERAFLFHTATLSATAYRRRWASRREVLDEAAVNSRAAPDPDPEQAAEKRDHRVLLDHVLDALPMKLRSVFVLFELEELTSLEIAQLLEIPSGTVASRLRRARVLFQERARALRALLASQGAVP